VEAVSVFAFPPVEASTIRAVFVGRNVTVTVNANPAQGGTVEGSGTYHYMDTVEIKAIPNQGYVFTGWNDGNNSNPRQVVVTTNVTYTANFQPTSDINTTEEQTLALDIYPNPASDVVCVNVQNSSLIAGKYEVAIIDLSGRICQTASVNGGNSNVDIIRLDVSGLPKGSYFIRIQNNGVNLVRKFVKK
jgi:uncharacterized repeat protein (TIGR02543 family)